MKNFPHQINKLDKLLGALIVAKALVDEGAALTDQAFGEQLTRAGVYTYNDKNLTIDEYLAGQLAKPASNRGYLTVSRDLRRFFELLGFITVFEDKAARFDPPGLQLLQAVNDEGRSELWRNSLLQLGLEGSDGEVSHPYRILLKLVNNFPGIETPKLMLALEAENDSEEEFARIAELVDNSLQEIIEKTGTSNPMAANAIKILPGIAAQLGDIERVGGRVYPLGDLVITEDEIATEKPARIRARAPEFRTTDAENIARDPFINAVSSVSIDISEAIRIRQRRLTEHQEIVRAIEAINEQSGYRLFEGKFDCLATKGEIALLYEVKTILETSSDEEKQTVKGVGQLKFYKHSIVHLQMGYKSVWEVIVFSRKPSAQIIQFCLVEDISVVWKDGDRYLVYNQQTGNDEIFSPDKLANI